jgi:transposase InsO family protein
MLPAEMNYETHDQELLAIVEVFRTWRHYLLGVHVTVIVLTDHNNLKYFMSTKALNPRQTRWAETLAQFDFEIRYRTGKSNPADGPSRRPDYKPSDDERATVGLPTLRSKLQAISPEFAEVNMIDQTSGQDALGSSWVNPVIASVIGAINARPERQADCPHGMTIEEASPPSFRHIRDLREVPPDEMSVIEGETPLDSAGSDEARVLNPVADAIGCKQCVSRIAVVAATRGRTVYDLPGEALLDLIRKTQQTDEFVRNKEYAASPSTRKKATGRPEESEDSPEGEEWRIDQTGLLRRHNSVFVPASPALRNEILQMVHDDPLSGHFGVKKTLELLARSWWWPGMKRSVQEYIETCPICQKTRVKRHRPYGALQPLPQPSGKWKEITMDFVTDLPPSRNGEGKVFDSLFVIVDRYTKMAKYIPVLKSITAEHLADIFLERIVLQFGIPEGIVSDRGAVFTSAFWSQLCYCLRIKRRLSTAFHPQTDGQTERQNQSLEHYFRCYCNHLQDDWVTKAPRAEFAYNNSVHSTTGMSPFFAMYGFHPNVPSSVRDDRPEGEVPAARKKAEEFDNEGKELAERWQRAIEFQKKWYDKKHTPMHFSIGDWVMLASTNLRQQRPNKKLSDRYLGPFKVTGVIGEQAYELELPEKWTVHPVFHVSLLEPYKRRPGEDPALHPEAVLLEGDEEEYEVEEILDDRWRRGRAEYLVRWTGYTSAHDQWVTELDLGNAGELLREYKLKMESRPYNARHEKYRRRKGDTLS